MFIDINLAVSAADARQRELAREAAAANKQR